MIEGKGFAKDSSPANKIQAKQACKTEIVRKLFQADLLPRYDGGNGAKLVRWIAESNSKYMAQKDLKARRDRLVYLTYFIWYLIFSFHSHTLKNAGQTLKNAMPSDMT